MNLLADESVEREVVERLRAEGHAIGYVAELAPGITDDQFLDEANSRSALLVTAAKDFGELVYRLGRVHAGVVLTRLAGLAPSAKADAVSQLFRNHAAELAGAFCVIAPGSIHIRRPGGP
jgi:predicted nuclease of predicted toxin-antitoxin system